MSEHFHEYESAAASNSPQLFVFAEVFKFSKKGEQEGEPRCLFQFEKVLEQLERNYESRQQSAWEKYWLEQGEAYALQQWRLKYADYLQEPQDEVAEASTTSLTAAVEQVANEDDSGWQIIWVQHLEEVYLERYSLFTAIFNNYVLNLKRSLLREDEAVPKTAAELAEEALLAAELKQLKLLGLPTEFGARPQYHFGGDFAAKQQENNQSHSDLSSSEDSEEESEETENEIEVEEEVALKAIEEVYEENKENEEEHKIFEVEIVEEVIGTERGQEEDNIVNEEVVEDEVVQKENEIAVIDKEREAEEKNKAKEVVVAEEENKKEFIERGVEEKNVVVEEKKKEVIVEERVVEEKKEIEERSVQEIVVEENKRIEKRLIEVKKEIEEEKEIAEIGENKSEVIEVERKVEKIKEDKVVVEETEEKQEKKKEVEEENKAKEVVAEENKELIERQVEEDNFAAEEKKKKVIEEESVEEETKEREVRIVEQAVVEERLVEEEENKKIIREESLVKIKKVEEIRVNIVEEKEFVEIGGNKSEVKEEEIEKKVEDTKEKEEKRVEKIVVVEEERKEKQENKKEVVKENKEEDMDADNANVKVDGDSTFLHGIAKQSKLILKQKRNEVKKMADGIRLQMEVSTIIRKDKLSENDQAQGEHLSENAEAEVDMEVTEMDDIEKGSYQAQNDLSSEDSYKEEKDRNNIKIEKQNENNQSQSALCSKEVDKVEDTKSHTLDNLEIDKQNTNNQTPSDLSEKDDKPGNVDIVIKDDISSCPFNKQLKGIKNSCKYNEMPTIMHDDKAMVRYWRKRFSLFSRFDQGIQLDRESWFSVTPERVAAHMAKRLACDVIVDGFCGSGGNAIQFAMTCHRVIAIDIDPIKVENAQHNARIYGVADRIEFHVGDFLSMCNDGSLPRANCVFISPPWGGPQYKKRKEYDIELSLLPVGASKLVEHARKISDNVALFLPRNSKMKQVVRLAGVGNRCEVEHNHLNARSVGITAMYGDAIISKK